MDLTTRQRELLNQWLGPFEVIADHSWPLQDTAVLQLRAVGSGNGDGDGNGNGKNFIVKASSTSHHIAREIRAHQSGVPSLPGRIPTMRFSSMEDGILVTDFIPGTLVQGTPAEFDASTYRQAGQLLALLQQPHGESLEYFPALKAKTVDVLARSEDLLSAHEHARLNLEIGGLRPGTVSLTFTHGDYQPRNWLLNDERINIIDFGRADDRHWTSDLVRLHHQQFQGRPDLEAAFYAGYGREVDAAETDIWRLENLNQAVGTVLWAHQIGDAVFEQQGREMVERLLA